MRRRHRDEHHEGKVRAQPGGLRFTDITAGCDNVEKDKEEEVNSEY
jgi:hypothetical protein